MGGPDGTADQLAAAIETLRDVDLNPLLHEGIRTILNAKAYLEEVYLRHRHNERAVESKGCP